MKDTLALALMRAEFCRACASERLRPKHDANNARLRAVMARVWRRLRTLSLALPRQRPPH